MKQAGLVESYLLQFQEPGPSVGALETVVVLLREQLQLHRDLVRCELSVEDDLNLRRKFRPGKPG